MPIRYEEIVKTVVFDVIDADDDGLIYRLEVLKSNHGFKGQLFRLDTFSWQPTFTKNKSDEIIYVLDAHSHSVDLDDKFFDDPQSCIDYVASTLEESFN